MLAAVLDTNVIISSLIAPGPPRETIHNFLTGRFELCTCDRLLIELAATLLRSEFSGLFTIEEAKEVVAVIQARGRFVIPTVHVSVCRDPGDDMVLECALAASAEFIVSGDRDLLILDPFQKIRIVSPRVFLNRLSE